MHISHMHCFKMSEGVTDVQRCELYEPMKRLDDNNIDNYFIIAARRTTCEPGSGGFRAALFVEQN